MGVALRVTARAMGGGRPRVTARAMGGGRPVRPVG